MSTWGGEPVEGELIGPYRVLRRIGHGGMGVVLEADDEALRRRVALKVIAPHLAENPAFRARFTREARALAALDSTHVVRVYAHGEDAGRLYIATQLVPDGDLGRLLAQQGPLTTREALDLIAQVASGLADAHAAGLVHRDIKPVNVLLRRGEGGPLRGYLTDFGIAREAGDDRTRTAGTVGTPSYMAPELHTGGVAGAATDVYSLGCLLWAALSGRPPYAGASDYQVVSAHLDQPVPQLPGPGPLVTEINRILRTAMAKEPADRYASASHLRDDLRRARTLPDSSATTGMDRRLLVALAGVVLLVLLIGAAAYAVARTDAEPGPEARSPSVDASGPPNEQPGAALEAATTSLARALERQGVMTGAQARCTAERWIEAAGLQQLREAGFFDDEWDYVDLERAAMTPEIEAGGSSAALACATEGRPG